VTGVVAVDWSGAKTGADSRLWVAHVRDGHLLELANGRTRPETIAHLIALKDASPDDGLFVGLDFSFSLPAWFLRQHGHTSAVDLWHHVARDGEAWLAACQPPFWGKKGDQRPPLAAHLRRTEEQARVGGIAAKSTFQIRGAGSVGTGSIRGMPYLLTLREAGFSIWPFDPPSRAVVIELYPRLCTGPVNKSSATARASYLDRSEWALTPGQHALAVSSEDAFDAAVSALVMHDRVDRLRDLRQAAGRTPDARRSDLGPRITSDRDRVRRHH
jgi:hypothetical protein